MELAHLVEEEGSPCGSSEARGDELRAVGQDGITVGAGEETSAPDVVQEDSAHDCRNQVSHYVGSANHTLSQCFLPHPTLVTDPNPEHTHTPPVQDQGWRPRDEVWKAGRATQVVDRC